MFAPDEPNCVPEFHKRALGGGVDHKSGEDFAADGVAVAAADVVFPQADGGAAFVCVHSDDGFELEPPASPFAGASTLFVSTTPGVGNCGMLCAGAAGACGVMAVGAGEGIATLSGVKTFSVGETGGCATFVGGSTSFGAVCE